LVLAAVLGALAGAAALFIYGLVDTVVVIVRTGEISTVGAKQLMLYFIEIFDLFLLGTVMLIMALSLYELFFRLEAAGALGDPHLRRPQEQPGHGGHRGHGGDVSRPNRVLERGGGAAWLWRSGGARDRCAELLPLDCKAQQKVNDSLARKNSET
jgi:hypothetical protein